MKLAIKLSVMIGGMAIFCGSLAQAESGEKFKYDCKTYEGPAPADLQASWGSNGDDYFYSLVTDSHKFCDMYCFSSKGPDYGAWYAFKAKVEAAKLSGKTIKLSSGKCEI